MSFAVVCNSSNGAIYTIAHTVNGIVGYQKEAIYVVPNLDLIKYTILCMICKLLQYFAGVYTKKSSIQINESPVCRKDFSTCLLWLHIAAEADNSNTRKISSKRGSMVEARNSVKSRLEMGVAPLIPRALQNVLRPSRRSSPNSPDRSSSRRSMRCEQAATQSV